MSRVTVALLIAAIVVLSSSRADAQVAQAAITPSGLVMLPAPPAQPAKPDETWVALGGLVDRAGHDGGRLQVDVFGGRHWAIGVSGQVFEDGDQVMNSQVPRLSGSVYGAVTFGVIGPLHVRLQVGYGATLATSADGTAAQPVQGVTSARFYETALLAHVELGRRWALVGGPIAQTAAIENPLSNPGAITAFIGLQHR
jgi:hypothetical protein